LEVVIYDFDYLVGSKIKGFDVMVQLSNSAPLMIFEGDEYLSSPIDLRPKFHWYKPDIALLSGIAWDHINVFPTNENYIKQFEIFISLIKKNGSLIYFKDDAELCKLVANRIDLKSIAYGTPKFKINDGISKLVTDFGDINLSVFGNHNMANINGARLVCNEIGVSDNDFYKHISSFEGTSNRLEIVLKQNNCIVYKDFAHAPSKLLATVKAVRKQFAKMNFVACFELHTFSSLNKKFIDEYKHSLDLPDEACVFYNNHTLKMKRLPDLLPNDIVNAFDRQDLRIFTATNKMTEWLLSVKKENTVFLLMSSGNFGGMNFEDIASKLTQ